jgi:hypothetical protein
VQLISICGHWLTTLAYGRRVPGIAGTFPKSHAPRTVGPRSHGVPGTCSIPEPRTFLSLRCLLLAASKLVQMSQKHLCCCRFAEEACRSRMPKAGRPSCVCSREGHCHCRQGLPACQRLQDTCKLLTCRCYSLSQFLQHVDFLPGLGNHGSLCLDHAYRW